MNKELFDGLEESYKSLVDHYAKMAMQAGWIDYARQRVKELQDDRCGNWTDLGQRVKQRMEELKR